MSTLRVDNIKSRTGTTVTIPDSQNLTVTGGLTVTGSQTFGAGATLDLQGENINSCLLYTSPSPRDRTRSRMPSSA